MSTPDPHSRNALIGVAGLVLALFLGLAPSVFAQNGVIEGPVLHADTDEPLLGANVRIVDTELGTSTGEDGHFELTGVPAGRHTVRVSYVGFGDATQELSLNAGGTRALVVRLEPTPGELGEIRVRAQENAFEQSYGTSSSGVSVEPAALEDFNPANNYDALRLVPGVNYLWDSGGRYSGPSRIRGGSAWTIPTAIEDYPTLRQSGIGAEDGGLKAGFGSIIPSIALEGVEIKKASSGVLYSGGANGGVIVNQLKHGQAGPPSGTLLLQANPLSEQVLMGGIGGGTEAFDYYVAAKGLNGSYDNMTDTRQRSTTDDHFYSGIARLGYDLNQHARLEATTLHGRDEVRYHQPERDDPETEIDESEALDPNRFETTNTTTFAGINLDHTLSEGLSYEAGYSFNREWDLRYSLTEDAAHRDRPQRTHSAFANAFFSSDLSRSITYNGKAGVEYVQHSQAEHAGGSDKHHLFRDYSAFSANSFSWNDRFFVNGGLRYLHGTDDWQTHDLVSYDAGLAYRIPTLESRFHVSAATGYARNKGFAFFFGPIDEAGGVKPSLSRTVEAGLEQPFSVTGSDEGRITLTLFQRDTEQSPVFSGWGAGEVYYEEHEARGIEAMLRERLGRRISILGSFSYTDTEVVGTTHPEGIGVGNTSVPVPQYSGGAGLEVRPTPRIRLSAIGTYSDGMRSRTVDRQTGEATVVTHSSYTRINLSGSYGITEALTVEVRLENLLDQTDLGYSSETFGPDGYQKSDSDARRPGRFAAIGVRFTY